MSATVAHAVAHAAPDAPGSAGRLGGILVGTRSGAMMMLVVAPYPRLMAGVDDLQRLHRFVQITPRCHQQPGSVMRLAPPSQAVTPWGRAAIA